MWLICIFSIKNLDAMRLPSFGRDFSIEVMQAEVAIASADCQKIKPEKSAVIDILGQILQVVKNLKQSHQADPMVVNDVLRSEAAQAKNIDVLVNLITQVAQFSNVQEGSVLWFFKKAKIRANQEILLCHILGDKHVRSALMHDFFFVLRSEVKQEINELIDSAALPDALLKMREFFQQYFGLIFWRDAFTSWINFVIDTAQYLLNSYVDTIQQDINQVIDQLEKENGNPLLNVVIDHADQILQQQIDELQLQTNQQIDQQQSTGFKSDTNLIDKGLISTTVLSVLIDFVYDAVEDLVQVSANTLEHAVQIATDQMVHHPEFDEAIDEIMQLVQQKIDAAQAELDQVVDAQNKVSSCL